MKNNSILTPLFKTIDKVVFGFEDIKEVDNDANTDFIDFNDEEEFDVERSTN